MAAATVILVIAVIVIVSLLAYYGGPPSNRIPPSKAKLLNPGYLENSRLFVVSATSRYGTHNDQECFILNVTLRNDYTAQELPPNSADYNGSGNAFFIMSTKLYSNEGQIAAKEVTEPHTMPVPGSPQHSLGAGNTEWFEIDMATSSREIESYAIDIFAYGGIPIP